MGIVIRTHPGPFQVVFVSIAAIAGVILILRGRAVGIGVEQSVWTSYLLAGSLVLGASVTLAGIALPNLWGAVVERAGLWMLVVLLSAYSVVIIRLQGLHAVLSVVFFAGYVIAGVWRIIQIHRLIRTAANDVGAQTARQEAHE